MGVYWCFVCYGYRKDEQDKNKMCRMKRRQGCAGYFAWKLMGLSAIPLHRKLNERGPYLCEYKKASGSKQDQLSANQSKVDRKAVYASSNEIYIRVLEQGKREKVLQGKRPSKPKSAWVRVEHNHTPIITEAILRRCRNC